MIRRGLPSSATEPLGRGSAEGKCALLRNARGGARRAVLPADEGGGGGTPEGPDAEAPAREQDVDGEAGTTASPGSESDAPFDDEDLESVRPVVLGAAWRLPVVLLAMDDHEESGLDMRFDPETGEPLAEE